VRDSEASAGLRFECTECGRCCRTHGEYAHVYVDDDELAALARLLGMTPGAFRRRYTTTDELGWSELRFHGDRCIFLDDATNRCTVYEARPTQCRTFPFWRTFVRNGVWTAEARAICEGLGRGRTFSAEEAEARMREQDEADAADT
jgi:Fe-S-cluster containining protein